MVAKSRSARCSYSRRASARGRRRGRARPGRTRHAGIAGKLVGELVHGVLELAQAALAHAQREELGAGEDRDGRVLQAPAELDALVDEDARPRRGGPRSAPAARGAAGCTSARAGRATSVAMRSSVSIAMSAPARSSSSSSRSICHERARTDELVVAELLGQREQLVGPGQPALGGVGAGGRDLALVEDVGERRRVAEPRARSPRASSTSVLAALGCVGSSRSRRRGARAGARAARCRPGRQRRERLLEHGDELVVDDPRREPEAAEAERGAAEQVAVAEAPARASMAAQQASTRAASSPDVHLRLPAQRAASSPRRFSSGSGGRSRARSAASKRSAACS